ncbi:hypothetical protein CK203_045976 [Vitis vinifera]|uniref:Uncharacterized protein n=1 Tax=Vitis vinifera TaxID=29760 RepID=A0A438HGW2_VITVI|nr:hypothetical protein CK203_045976 [Vitis vinifera]
MLMFDERSYVVMLTGTDMTGVLWHQRSQDRITTSTLFAVIQKWLYRLVNEYKARKNRDVTSNEGLGRAALVTTTPQLSFTSQIESSSDETHLNDQDDFIEVTQPRRTDIANANRVTYPVTGAGTVADILTKESLGVVLRMGGYIIWMTLALVRLIICTTQALRKDRFGYGIDA